MIWKLKEFGFKKEELLTLWKVVLQPIAEYTYPLWHSGLLECDTYKLEQLRRKAIGLIFGITYIDYRRYYNISGQPVSYEEALKRCDLPTLAERREILTTKFALETFKSGIHNDFFEDANSERPDTRSKPIVIEPSGKTSRFMKSAIPYMMKKINKNGN